MEKERVAPLDEEPASLPTWIFESDFRLPPKVCILAPGPRGRPHYGDIPKDYCVIALNKAVFIPEVKIDIWLMNLADQDWFEAANAAFDGLRVFWREEKENRDYSSAVEKRLLAIDNTNSYYFRVIRPGLYLSKKGKSLDQLTERGILDGGTVMGAALQLAYHFGAHEVLLCGADMSGDAYWDGSLSEQLGHGATWSCTGELNTLIRWMTQTHGITVMTLSPTKLDVPFWNGSRVLEEQTR